MYYYIYDQFLSHKKYDKILAQIESKITDLGIKNRIIKMSILKSVGELVTDALRKGAQTIVVAGNDRTINQIVNLVAGQDVVLGIIPIHDLNYKKINDNSIANFLGIFDPLEACEIISARKIETINLGEINGYYFISSVQIVDNYLELQCNNKYNISTLSRNNLISVYNFAPEQNQEKNTPGSKKLFNPQDNFLEVVIQSRKKKSLNNIFKPLISSGGETKFESIFRVKKINIKSEKKNGGSVVVDNFKILKTPIDIKIADKKLRIIVGKARKF